MRSKRGPIGLVVLTAAFLVFAVGASSAAAAISVTKWEGLTCKENADLPEELGPAGKEYGYETGAAKLPEPTEQCTNGTSSKHFTQAAGHPNFGITDFRLLTAPHPPFESGGFPTAFVKETVVNTPEGLSVNPEALPQCTVEQLTTLSCPPAAFVGVNYLTVAGETPDGEGKCEGEPLGFPVPGECLQVRVALPVYNLVPFSGSPSMVGFMTEAGPTFIVGSLSPVDQHVIFTIEGHPPSVTSPPLIESRLVFNGQAGNGTYLTMPSNCAGGQVTLLHLDSQGPPYEATQTETDASYTTPSGATGCESVPFDPTVKTKVDSSTDSPDPFTFNLGIPFDSAKEIANSYLKVARVTLPEGMGINPSLANGLETCTNAQFAYHTNDEIKCPKGSEIGTVDVETPSLPPGSLHGKVYVAQPEGQDPSSGKQFRIFLTAGSERYGVNVRLKGQVFPNLKTGQVTVVVEENPQATFSEFIVHINGGAHGALTTPGTCGPHSTTTDLTPWSEAGDAHPSGEFSLTSAPGGGNCPKTLADRPFSPYYAASPQAFAAGKFAPFRLDFSRNDGNQEVKRIEVNLPPGEVAKLKGVEYCPESGIAAAVSASGKSEMANPSCPSSSLVGSSKIAAGSGSDPFRTEGKAYLAGPYKGAPISMVFITPAVAGPYDLGNVVVRAALNIDPETAEVHAVSDPIPNVFGGVKLDVREINVNVDRSEFTTNPTTCREPLPLKTTVAGGGGNPAEESQWKSIDKTEGIQFRECKKLGFKPKFYARIMGGKNQTKRTKNPKFRAIVEARNGDANLRRSAFILPRATILDQSHIKTVCTRVQLAADECPKNSIYGHAEATSPLLAGKLEGPVYLTSSSHKLPDLLADLHGQIPIRLRGVISSAHGRLKTVFNETPDVAVKKFILTMKGGSRGLLVNSRDLCSRQTTGFLNLLAQNSRRVRTNNLRLNIPACRGGGNHKK